MAFNKQFIVDQVKTHDNIYGFENAIALIKARWKITHSDYPNGFAYHAFHKYFHHDTYNLETFTPIQDVTDAMMEEWVSGAISPEAMNEIYNAAFPYIQATDAEHGLTTYYQNPEVTGMP
jgi:hypothetical protein